MTRVTFLKLVRYLEERCNFHKDDSGFGVTWTCDNSLAFTKKFCEKNNLDFAHVKALLEGNGGFCDCEILFNCVERISKGTFLPAKAEAQMK